MGFKQIFYDWCIENSKQDLLDRWDYELNKCSPFDISSKDHNGYYFKCENKLHNSEKHIITTLTSGRNIKKSGCCSKCNSFAQWGIDNICLNFLEKYWDYEKNVGVDPWKLQYSSRKDIYIKCINDFQHPSYNVKPYNFIKGTRCPYCKSKKVIPQNSFAKYLIDTYGKNVLRDYWDYDKNQGIDPWNIPKSSHIKIWIKCKNTDYHTSHKTDTNKIYNRGIDTCPYCSHRKIHKLDSLGYLYPQVLKIWSDKNKKSPYEYAPQSNQKVFWKCQEDKHEDYMRTICDAVRYNFRCYECSNTNKESYLQKKVNEYLSEVLCYQTNHECLCGLTPINPKTKHSMPFDNEVIINNQKLIVEVNGAQHYRTDAYTGIWRDYNSTPEQQLHKRKLYDRYKKYVAFCNGYFYLAIPYTADDKKETYKEMIDNKIKEINSKSCNRKIICL